MPVHARPPGVLRRHLGKHLRSAGRRAAGDAFADDLRRSDAGRSGGGGLGGRRAAGQSRADVRIGIAPADSAEAARPGATRPQPFALGVGVRLRPSLDSGSGRRHGGGDRRRGSLRPHVAAGRHRELAQAAAENIGPDACAVLLGNHGVVAGGRDLAEAVVASQFVEKAAMILIHAQATRRRAADRRGVVARRAPSLPVQVRQAGGSGGRES